MKIPFVLAMSTALVAACASTQPGDGASIQYFMPETSATATLSMIIEKCPDANGVGMELEASLGVGAKASASPSARLVSGNQLASVRTKRNVTINVDENGVLSGINSTVEDRTAAILSNSVSALTKLIAVAAPVAGPAGVAPPVNPMNRLQCQPEVSAALARVAALRSKIAALRSVLAAGGNVPRRSELLQDINALALEVARIRTGPLTKTLTATIPLGGSESTTPQGINFNFQPLRDDWFAVPAAGGALSDDEMRFLFGASWKSAMISSTPALKPTITKNLAKCKLEIAVPGQTRGKIEVSPYGTAVTSVKTASISTPIPQWDLDDTLCLSAQFAENRTVNVSFNSFGQRKSLTWTSQARGEALTSALGSVVGSANDLKTALDGDSEAERQQETINEVDRLLKYNAANLCLQAAREGATSCPAAPPTE